MMGSVFAEITLRNAGDVSAVTRGLIKEPEIRQTTVQSVVDTGALTLVINEEMRQKLGLGIVEQREATFANGAKEICTMTEAVAVHWKDRMTLCQALVVPGTGEVLLGAIPLEGMDLMVNPVDQKLVGVHGDKAVSLVI